MRLAILSLLLLAACQGGEAPANQAVAAPKAAAPTAEGDVGAAQRLVRERLRNPQGLTFFNPHRTASEGVSIVCGAYAQGADRRRYIVVDRTDVFIETELQPGEMDRYFAEFCSGQRRG